jgi:hypothetical protein
MGYFDNVEEMEAAPSADVVPPIPSLATATGDPLDAARRSARTRLEADAVRADVIPRPHGDAVPDRDISHGIFHIGELHRIRAGAGRPGLGGDGDRVACPRDHGIDAQTVPLSTVQPALEVPLLHYYFHVRDGIPFVRAFSGDSECHVSCISILA